MATARPERGSQEATAWLQRGENVAAGRNLHIIFQNVAIRNGAQWRGRNVTLRLRHQMCLTNKN